MYIVLKIKVKTDKILKDEFFNINFYKIINIIIKYYKKWVAITIVWFYQQLDVYF